MRAYMNGIKIAVINQYLPKRRVLDLGIGRGQDIMKYSLSGVSSVTGIDLDIHALQELVYRLIQLVQQRQAVCPVQVHQSDLGAESAQRLGALASGCSAVCSFFSFHYYSDNKSIYEMLKGLPRGALFILSIVDRDSVQELLAGKTSFKSKYY